MKNILLILTLLATVASGCRQRTTNSEMHFEVKVVETPQDQQEHKVHYHDNFNEKTGSIVYTDYCFVVVDSDRYVNMRSGPSVTSAIMTTIPNYTVVIEAIGREGNWLLVYYSSNQTGYYGYVYSDRLVKIPQRRIDSWKIHEGNEFKISRVVNLISTEQRKDSALQVFFLNGTRYGFVYDKKKNSSEPLDFLSGFGLRDETDYKNAGYDYEENASAINRYSYRYNSDSGGYFDFDIQAPNTILNVRHRPLGEEKKTVGFVVEKDRVLNGTAVFW